MTSTNIRRTAKASALVLVASLSLAACGGGSNGGDQTTESAPSAAASAIDPCAILSQADVDRLLRTTATVRGPAVAQFRGRTCSWDVPEVSADSLETGTLAIDAFKGGEFFVPGTIGDPLDAVSDQAQEDLDHATMLFIIADDVVQAHVLSPTRRDRTLPVAQAAAGALEQACPPSP